MDNKQKVVALLKSIETGATEPVGYINPEKYIQHNLGAEDGLAGFGKLLQQLPKGSARVKTLSVFEDGPYVIAHSEYNFFGPKTGVDIFRFEDGRIVEHWDNLQELSDAKAEGYVSANGPITARDPEKTEANRSLVRKEVEEWMNRDKNGSAITIEIIHKVFAEGNFVLSVSEGRISGAATAMYDLFSVENGKIAAHWQVTEAIPQRKEWKNENGKFGF